VTPVAFTEDKRIIGFVAANGATAVLTTDPSVDLSSFFGSTQDIESIAFSSGGQAQTVIPADCQVKSGETVFIISDYGGAFTLIFDESAKFQLSTP
jgi:hypothetical protein